MQAGKSVRAKCLHESHQNKNLWENIYLFCQSVYSLCNVRFSKIKKRSKTIKKVGEKRLKKDSHNNCWVNRKYLTRVRGAWVVWMFIMGVNHCGCQWGLSIFMDVNYYGGGVSMFIMGVNEGCGCQCLLWVSMKVGGVNYYGGVNLTLTLSMGWVSYWHPHIMGLSKMTPW